MTSITSFSAVRARSETGRFTAFFSISAISFSGRSGWPAVGRSRFLVALDELAAQPAEDVIGDAGGVADVGVLGETARLEALVSEFLDQTFERHAVLQGDGGQRADRVHQAADGAAFLGHVNEELAGLAIFEEADGDITFVTGDLELVG